MKKLLLFILLLPFFAQAQFVNGSIQRQASDRVVRYLNGANLDSLAVIQKNSLANLDMLRYNSATGKFIPRTPAQVAGDLPVWTSNTTQTGLTGDKTTSGVITSERFVATATISSVFTASSATTGRLLGDLINGSGRMRWAVEGSTADGVFGGTTPYMAAIGSVSNRPLGLFTNNLLRYKIDSLGNHDFKSGTAKFGSSLILTAATSGTANTDSILVKKSTDNIVYKVKASDLTVGSVPLAGITGLGSSVATALAINIGTAGSLIQMNGNAGTPSTIVLTNGTGLPVGTGISGLGTSVATALAINVGTAGALIQRDGSLGTPSSGVATNLTGTATALNIGGNAATSTSATTSTNLAGGSGGTIPYQSAAGTTVMLANGTTGNILQANGTTVAPSWVTPSTITAGAATNTAITDDNSTNAIMYPTWVTTTTGNLPQKVSSTGVTWNPSDQTLRPVRLETTGGVYAYGDTPNIYLGKSAGTGASVPSLYHYSANGTYYWTINTGNAAGTYGWYDGTGLNQRMSLTQGGLLTSTSFASSTGAFSDNVTVSSASTKGVVVNGTDNASFHGLILQNSGTAVAGMEVLGNTGEIKIGGYQNTNDFFPVIYSDGVAALTFGLGAAPTATFISLAAAGSRAALADANGTLSAPVSDRSVKQNIRAAKYGLAEIMLMKPVTFEYKDKFKRYGDGDQLGLIAQDLEKVIPEAVFTDRNTNLKGINYLQFDGIYIKALQDLQKEIDALQSVNNGLQKRIIALEAK